MKNNDHKLVQDLFPSYIDELTSDETNKFVEEHIASCEECKNILEAMKTKILKENHTNLEDKKIKCVKSVGRKLKILNVLIFIIVVFVILLFCDYCRKVYILKNLENFDEYSTNNYICTSIAETSKENSNMNMIKKFYYKDGNKLSLYTTILTSSMGGETFPVVMKGKNYVDGDKEYSFAYDNVSGKIDSVSIFNLDKDEEYYNSSPETYKKCMVDNIFKIALNSNITTVKFDGIACYKIEYKEPDMEEPNNYYFEKNTGILRKTNYEEYYYQFNVVSDEMLKVPEIPDGVPVNMEE